MINSDTGSNTVSLVLVVFTLIQLYDIGNTIYKMKEYKTPVAQVVRSFICLILTLLYFVFLEDMVTHYIA
jgi:hypothetical protein